MLDNVRAFMSQDYILSTGMLDYVLGRDQVKYLQDNLNEGIPLAFYCHCNANYESNEFLSKFGVYIILKKVDQCQTSL
jgi:hypothetical protein